MIELILSEFAIVIGGVLAYLVCVWAILWLSRPTLPKNYKAPPLPKLPTEDRSSIYYLRPELRGKGSE